MDLKEYFKISKTVDKQKAQKLQAIRELGINPYPYTFEQNIHSNELLEKYKGKRIAVVSHGGAIKFYLLSYCNVNERLNIEYKGKELNITSPCLVKLIFKGNKLVELKKIQ